MLFDLQRWEPFAQSSFNVVWALLVLSALNAPPTELNLERYASGPAFPTP